jgi:hypothetical protein
MTEIVIDGYVNDKGKVLLFYLLKWGSRGVFGRGKKTVQNM